MPAPHREPPRPRTVLCVYGTRPEAVKMAPLIAALAQEPGLDAVVAVTGQHREMARQVEATFGIVPDIDLDLFRHGQPLHELTARALTALTPVIEERAPSAVVVQGDTTTAMAAALAAFYARVPVVHLEAGLRSGDLAAPFPEEANRSLIGRLAALHLAPTSESRANLVRENVDAAAVVVTGNTVIDALHHVVGRPGEVTDPEVAAFLDRTPVPVLLTTHRRESWGEPMAASLSAMADLVRREPDVGVLFPVHANPAVGDLARRHLGGLGRVLLTPALSYPDFCRAMAASAFVVSDSGGVQEEAPSLGRPVLVLREVTERGEALETGLVELVGTDPARIQAAALERIRQARQGIVHPPASPYGDGRAATRSVAAIRALLDDRPMPADYSSSAEPVTVSPS